MVLLVRCGAPSCCKRADDGEASGDLLVPAVGFAVKGYGVVIDGQERGVLHVVDAGGVALARLGFEVEHGKWLVGARTFEFKIRKGSKKNILDIILPRGSSDLRGSTNGSKAHSVRNGV